MRSLALYYISIPCFAFLRKYTLYPTCRLLLIDLPRTADYNYKGSISSSGPLPVQESWNHMQDLKHVFSYLKPYRREYRRFFQQQFKRSCLPDGPKVGSVTLSPRGDWRMPSDACASAWQAELDTLSAEG